MRSIPAFGRILSASAILWPVAYVGVLLDVDRVYIDTVTACVEDLVRLADGNTVEGDACT